MLLYAQGVVSIARQCVVGPLLEADWDAVASESQRKLLNSAHVLINNAENAHQV